jgi:hypothetical protein
MSKPEKRNGFSTREKNGPAATFVLSLGLINSARKYITRLDIDETSMVAVNSIEVYTITFFMHYTQADYNKCSRVLL